MINKRVNYFSEMNRATLVWITGDLFRIKKIIFMTSNFHLLMLFLGCFLVISVSSKKLYQRINYDYLKPTEHIFYFRVLPFQIYKDSNG